MTLMNCYFLVFIVEIVVAYFCFMGAKRILRSNKYFQIVAVSCLISLVVGYIVASRSISYEITMNYLKFVNQQKISEGSQGLNKQEEEQLKNAFFNKKQFKDMVFSQSLKATLYPFFFVLLIMIIVSRRERKNGGKRQKAQIEEHSMQQTNLKRRRKPFTSPPNIFFLIALAITLLFAVEEYGVTFYAFGSIIGWLVLPLIGIIYYNSVHRDTNRDRCGVMILTGIVLFIRIVGRLFE